MAVPAFAAILVTGAPLFGAGPDGARAREAHLDLLRAALVAHAGTELRATTDGLIASFPAAAAAVECAVAMQRAVGAGASGASVAGDGPGRSALRVGIDAGEPELDAAGGLSGRPVFVAERLCAMAADGEILVSDVVRLLAAARLPGAASPSGALRVPGEREPVSVARVAWSPPADQSGAADFDATGRSDPRPITVVIADDQQLVRAGFRVILESEPDIVVVGEAPDGRAAIDVVARRRPDVVLMDIRMPELDGLSAAERVLSDPDRCTAVVMLTTFDANEHVYRALRIGASGFLLKDTPADRLLDAVRVAAAGDALIAPSITRRLIGEFTRAARPDPDAVPPALQELTARELDVLGFVARGLSNAEIAAELVLGENTVKTHVARMLGKLGLRDRVQAVVLAYESGLVIPDG